MDLPSSSSNYSIRQIIQYQMFACGDVEYPIEECIDFVQSVVVPHMKNIKYNSTFTSEDQKDGSEDEEEVEDDQPNPLVDKFLAAISEIDSDEKLAKFISDTSQSDSVKLSRNKKIAERTQSMTVEKYKRFAEARSCSFIRLKGRTLDEYINGFTVAIGAPSNFDRDLVNLLNFCAIEMLNVLVENADKIRRRELGNLSSKMKLGAIQLEHYQAAANPVLKRKSKTSEIPPKKPRLQ